MANYIFTAEKFDFHRRRRHLNKFEGLVYPIKIKMMKVRALVRPETITHEIHFNICSYR